MICTFIIFFPLFFESPTLRGFTDCQILFSLPPRIFFHLGKLTTIDKILCASYYSFFFLYIVLDSVVKGYILMINVLVNVLNVFVIVILCRRFIGYSLDNVFCIIKLICKICSLGNLSLDYKGYIYKLQTNMFNNQ